MPGIWRDIGDAAADFFHFVSGRRDPEIPPRRYQRVGKGDFRAMGTSLAALLLNHGLQRDDRVLDIGCGSDAWRSR